MQGLRRRSWAFRSLLLLPFAIVVDRLAVLQHSTLSIGPHLPEGKSADAVVILGYALKRDGTPTLPLRQRVQGGINLYDQGVADYVVFSGGHPGGGIRGQSEAHAMYKYAERLSKKGPSSSRWLLEDQSTSTRENAVYSLQYAVEHRWGDIVIATSPYHQWRSKLTFQCAIKQQFQESQRPKVWMADVKMNHVMGMRLLWEPWLRQFDFVRELLALAWYWYNGWLC